MNRLLARIIYGGKPVLRPYEQTCISAFLTKMHDSDRHILEGQLAKVDLIQRYSNDKLVTFHFLGNKPDLPLFGNQVPELNVGRVQLNVAGRAKPVSANLVFCEGRLSSLEFNTIPKPLLEQVITVSRVELFADFADATPESVAVPSSTPLLGSLQMDFDVRDVEPPFNKDDRQKYLSSISTEVPSDYEQLLSETNGFKVGDWEYLGANSRRLVQPDSTLIVVAENREYAICLREGDTSSRVYVHNGIDDEVKEVGPSFLPIFRQQIDSVDEHPISNVRR